MTQTNSFFRPDSFFCKSRVFTRKALVAATIASTLLATGCTTNYLTNSTKGTYGVPATERTIPQRLLDRSIEHTAKVNIYGLEQNLQQSSRMSIDSFNSEVLLSGEVPSEAIKEQIGKVVASMPDVRRVYNELKVGVARGASATVHDGYISSKIMAKVAASNTIKSSQIKVVTNDGIVYILGRLTPTQQSHLIDMANKTAGVIELVLMTTLVNDAGVPVNQDDIMFENQAVQANLQPPAPIVEDTADYQVAPANSGPTPVIVIDETDDFAP